MLISNNNLLVSYVVAILDTLILFLFMTTRPYPISMLFFLLEIFILEKYLSTSEKKWLCFLPLLSLLLINLHGAIWPFFFIILLPYFIDSFKFKIGFVQGEGYPKRVLIGVTFVAFLVGFLNPYGWELMTYLFRSYGNQSISSYVNEMQPPNFQNADGLFVFSVFLLVLLPLIFRKPPRLKLRFALLMLGTAFMTLTSIRNLSLFAICGFPMIAYTLKDFQPYISRAKPNIARKLIILVPIFLAVVLLSFSYRLFDSQMNQDESIPNEAIDFIVREYREEQISLFTDYNWGGYAEFRGLKPFIDARAEVFIKKNNHKADILDDLIAVRTGRLHYETFIARYKINVLLVENNELLDVYLSKDDDYLLVYQDQDYAVYQKP